MASIHLRALGAAALLCMFVTPAHGAPVETARKDRARIASVELERSDVVASPTGGNPAGGIAPCVKIVRTFFQAAQGGTPYALKFHFKYTSGGKTRVKNVFVPLKSMRVHRTQPSDTRFIRLDTVVDVSARPVDQGTSVKGSVQLKKNTPSRGELVLVELVPL